MPCSPSVESICHMYRPRDPLIFKTNRVEYARKINVLEVLCTVNSNFDACFMEFHVNGVANALYISI